MLYMLGAAACFCICLSVAISPPKGHWRFGRTFFLSLLSAGILAYFPIQQYMFEKKLEKATERFTKFYGVNVICQSRFGSFFHWNKLGFVVMGSAEINLRPDVCSGLASYLRDPATANKAAISDYDNSVMPLHVLTHEAMHVMGVYDEVETDCKAFQRNHRMAELLGVETGLARQSAIVIHRFRSPRHPYYSPQCEPGTPMDDRLADAVWVRE